MKRDARQAELPGTDGARCEVCRGSGLAFESSRDCAACGGLGRAPRARPSTPQCSPCRPRVSDGRCIWCERELAKGTTT